jgi:hypothetical protein
MGVRRKRRRREERLEEEEQAREPAQENVLEKERPREREREATPADKVLDLQKTAGNRATTAAISRWGLPWFPATAAPQWPKEPQVIIDGVVIPLQSFSWSEGQSGDGGLTTSPGAVQLNDVTIMTTLGEHSTDLHLAAVQGRQLKTVVIVVPGKDGKGFTVTLTEGVISSYSISERNESWSLAFRKKEFSQSPPKAQPRP